MVHGDNTDWRHRGHQGGKYLLKWLLKDSIVGDESDGGREIIQQQ